jgi:hypothetical protein
MRQGQALRSHLHRRPQDLSCRASGLRVAIGDDIDGGRERARAEPGDGMAWVASSRGEVYYRRGCSNANRLVAENRVYFRTEEEAKHARYRRSGSPGC